MPYWPALILYAIFILTVYFVARRLPHAPVEGRFAQLDGLRGYLALNVVACHGAVWFGYLRTGQWEVPPSRVYANITQDSMLLFLMITGFLFGTKLLQARIRPIDWLNLFVGRVLRLFPAYLTVVAMMFLVVGIVSGFTLRVPITSLARGAFDWIAFTLPGNPALNGVASTDFITAGVIWSLRYEWLFYLSLPMLGILARTLVPLRWLIPSVVAVAAISFHWHPSRLFIAAFAAGMIAATIVSRGWVLPWMRGKLGALIATIPVAVTVVTFSSGYTVPGLALMAITFLIVSSGNTFFGLLTWSLSRFMGQISYGIYLLHGLVFTIAFRFIVGMGRASQYSFHSYWGVVWMCAPIVVLLSTSMYVMIERPAMNRTSTVARWLRNRSPRRYFGSRHRQPNASVAE